MKYGAIRRFTLCAAASVVLSFGFAGVVCAQTPPPAVAKTVPSAPAESEAESLKQLIGVNSSGLRGVELPKLPAMSLSGFALQADGTARALLEINDLNRTFLVKTGTKIPITVPGRVSPIGRSELVGLGQAANTAAPPPSANVESQIILEVIDITPEGVTVKAGLIDQTIIVR